MQEEHDADCVSPAILRQRVLRPLTTRLVADAADLVKAIFSTVQMSEPQVNVNFLSVLLLGTLASVLHAVLPSHWLPFVLVGRAQGWSRQRIVGSTVLASSVHVVVTLVLGLFVAAVGHGLKVLVEEHVNLITSLLLMGVGVAYVLFPSLGHSHPDAPYEHKHQMPHHYHPSQPRLSDKAALLSLIAMLIFSPCEGIYPFLFAASVEFGWYGWALLALVTGLLTIGCMSLMVAVMLMGFERFPMPLSEERERRLVGVLIVLLGVLVLVWD